MFFHNDLRYVVWKRQCVCETHKCEHANRSTKEVVVITKERIAVILLTHENRESMSPTLRFSNVRYGALLVRAACLLVALVGALVFSSQGICLSLIVIEKLDSDGLIIPL
jgi:hypothetical protein